MEKVTVDFFYTELFDEVNEWIQFNKIAKRMGKKPVSYKVYLEILKEVKGNERKSNNKKV